MNTTPIACDLTALDPEERQIEQRLLHHFRSMFTNVVWNGSEHHVSVPADRATLSRLGEFLALERRCCPFVRFALMVDSSESASLTITGPPGSREFIEQTFGLTTG